MAALVTVERLFVLPKKTKAGAERRCEGREDGRTSGAPIGPAHRVGVSWPVVYKRCRLLARQRFVERSNRWEIASEWQQQQQHRNPRADLSPALLPFSDVAGAFVFVRRHKPELGVSSRRLVASESPPSSLPSARLSQMLLHQFMNGGALDVMHPTPPPPLQKDTTFTKIFVGGLPYHTNDASLRKYFEAFGDIDEAVVITDRQTGKSRGYGFVSTRNAHKTVPQKEHP